MTKQCSNCIHGMASETPELIYCIAHPPVPVSTPNGVVSHFPMLRLFGKCDEFKAGKNQTIGQA